jgi:anaerobic selenocysteine-containing dehydrogenase
VVFVEARGSGLQPYAPIEAKIDYGGDTMSEMETRRANVVGTLCGLCQADCGIECTVDDGQLVKVRGMRAHPISQGSLCVKGASAVNIVHAPGRVTRPLHRVGEKGGGQWEEISWERALDVIEDNFRRLKEQHGAESVALFRGQAADWGAPWQYATRFMFAFGSPNTATPSSICYFPRLVAEVVTYAGITAPDYEHASVIVEWGACRPETHLGFWRMIRRAQGRGAKLVVVDPVRSKMAESADLWLRVRPGTDGALALSIIQVIVEEGLYDREFVSRWTVGFDELAALAGEYPPDKAAAITLVPPEEIRRAARLIAGSGATAIYAGNGVEHHTNTFQTLRAIAALRAIAGTLDVSGGNVFEKLLPWVGLKGSELLPDDQKPKRIGEYDLFTDISSVVPFPTIVDSILSEKPYPVRGLLVVGGNPVMTMPNEDRIVEALKKLEFLVVADPFLTRTAKLADVVLPAATHFEKAGFLVTSMFGESKNHVHVKQKALDVGECWPDWKIYFELARRLGFEQAFPWQDVEQAIDFQIKPSGFTVEQLKAHPEGIRFKDGETYRKYEDGGFSTPSGKVELYSEKMADRGYDPLPRWHEPVESPVSAPDLAVDYPLIGCAAGKTVNYVNSQFHQIPDLNAREPEPWVLIHPDDAASRGISQGDWVRIRSPRSSVEMKATVSDRAMPGVVSPSGCWGEQYPQSNMNRLIDDQARDPISCSTGSRSFLCQVERM